MTCFGRSAEPERGGHWEVRLKGADLHTLMCLRTLSFTADRRMAARLFTVLFLQRQGAAEWVHATMRRGLSGLRFSRIFTYATCTPRHILLSLIFFIFIFIQKYIYIYILLNWITNWICICPSLMSLDLVSQVKPQMHDEGVGCEGVGGRSPKKAIPN